jgi:putative Holliday junction resolvase
MPAARILALDLGERRVGVAVSDPLGVTAQGLPTLERRNRRADLDALRRLVEAYSPALILVGNPLRLSGKAGAQAGKAAAFADSLRRKLGVRVELWDERLTTREAHRALDAGGATRRQRRNSVDRMAAVLLLQSYLDRALEPPMHTDEHG